MATSSHNPAFPTSPIGSVPGREGMTKREYFAAAALQGILANSSQLASADHTASLAIEYADKLLEKLNQPSSSTQPATP